jgi:Protein of unknown function (DUF3108)
VNRTTLASLALLASLSAAAQPMAISARYAITNSGMTIGTVNESFVRNGDTYAIESVTQSEGVLKMFVDDRFTVHSTGKVGADGLQPLAYDEHRAKDGKRDLQSRFDWEHGVMRTSLHGESSEVALPHDTQDRISMMYQFINIKHYGDTLTVPMADRRKVEMFTYKLVDEGTLSTPAGEFATRHYQRIVNNPKDTKADVWLAKDRYNFPVRIVLDDPKGFRLEQTIQALDTR